MMKMVDSLPTADILCLKSSVKRIPLGRRLLRSECSTIMFFVSQAMESMSQMTPSQVITLASEYLFELI